MNTEHRNMGSNIEYVDFESKRMGGYLDAVAQVGQQLYEFRKAYEDPRDTEKPVTHSYTINDHRVDIFLSSSDVALVQVQDDEGGRLTYEYDPSATYAIVVHMYDNPDTDKSTHRLGLKPNDANIPTALSVYEYLRNSHS
ncbi:MAG: hypothetical protein ABIP74_02605 [Candidatus Saccharimonas sp.]